MKKLLTIAILLLSSINVFSQQFLPDKHITVNNSDGSIEKCTIMLYKAFR